MWESYHDYCYVKMLKEDHKTLKYNHGEESLLEKMSHCHNHLEKSSTTKINEHTLSV